MSGVSNSVIWACATYSFKGVSFSVDQTVIYFGTIAIPTRATSSVVPTQIGRTDPYLRPSARSDLEFCRESVWFFQARRPVQPVSGSLERSARLCTPRPSRRFTKRTMEQCALTSLGTIAFDLLAPFFRCQQEILATLEAGSRAWNSSPVSFYYGIVSFHCFRFWVLHCTEVTTLYFYEGFPI